MTEKEALNLVDVVSNPFWKILVAYKPCMISHIFVLHQFFEILVWKFIVSTEIAKDVFNRNKAIVVSV